MLWLTCGIGGKPVDRRQPLMRAVLVRKKTGYPHLWRTVTGPKLKRLAAEANDGLIHSLKWNKVTADAHDYDARLEHRSLVETHHSPIPAASPWADGRVHELVTMC